MGEPDNFIDDIRAQSAPNALLDALLCPVCESKSARHDFDKDGIPYYRCRHCMFRFSRPKDNANFRTDISGFEDAYVEYLGPDPADRPNFDNLWSYMSRSARLEGATLLDIGAGGGKWVRYLTSRGIDAQGIEPGSAVFDHFLKDDRRFFQGDLSAYRALHPGASFDIVTCFDVIEHVPEPTDLLRGIAAVLRPGGFVFISCPDDASIFARLLGRRWPHYNHYHLSFLSPETIRRVAADVGLKVDNVFHPSRARATSYLARYFFEFLLRRRPPKITRWLDGRFMWINLHDVLCATLSK
jgi:2-polyprenyl-6-hydroxyphenyl methylase/3-demethylubiquinone-9 3-methyltransferase